jgi:hypothetical protein
MYDQNLRTRMATMSPQQLKQFAMMHKDDPFVVSMALDIDNTRKAGQRQQAMQAAQQPQPKVVDQTLASIGQEEVPPQAMQAAPQMQAGLPQVPAQNIANMADGGIAGYAEGKEVKGDRESYRAYAMQKAQELGLDPSFVDGIFKAESDYNPKARSGTGPVGIGQLTTYIAKTFGIKPKDRLDPYKNMDASIGFMDYLNKRYKGDKAKMAVAYNQGEGVLNEHLKQNGGKLVPEKLHENVKTANKEEPRKYLEKLTAAGAITPVQTAGTREAPRTPEMLARQKEAMRRREVAEALPLSAAQAGDSASRDPSQPSFIDKLQRAAPPALGGKGELVSEVFGKKRGAQTPVVPTPVPAAEPRAGEFFPSNMLNPDIGKNAPISAPEGIARLQGGRFAAESVPGTAEAAAADKARAAALAKAEKETSFMDRIYGGAEALHGLALGYPAMATGLINLPSVQNFLAPKTEKGKEYSADLHNLLVEQGKLPPFIPSLGVSQPKALTPKAIAEAAEAAKLAEAAKTNAETAAAPRLPAPAKGGPKADVLAGYRTTPGTGEVTPRFAMEQPRTFNIDPAAAEFGALSVRDRLLREQAGDVVKAKQEAARLGEKADIAGDATNAARLIDEQNTGIRRLQTNAPKVVNAVGSGATTLPVTPNKVTEPSFVRGSEEPGYDFSKPEKTGEVPIEERSRTFVPEKKTGFGALSDEDYLMMGLNMLQAPAGQPGGEFSQLGQNIGRSGLATLGARREREKTTADRLQQQAFIDYYKGMTENLGREPDTIRQLRALQADPKLMETMMRMEAGKDIAGQRARILQVYDAGVANGAIDPATMSREQFLRQYGGSSLGGNADLFKVVGSRPS